MTPGRIRRLATALLIAAAGGCAVLAADAGPASADTGSLELNINGSGYTATPSDPLITAANFVPGSTVSGVMGVWNTRSVAGSISATPSSSPASRPSIRACPSRRRPASRL